MSSLSDKQTELRDWKNWQEDRKTQQVLLELQGIIDAAQYAIVMQPIKSADEVYAQEFQKGLIMGTLRLQNVVENIITNLEYDINLMIESKTGEEDE